jgi:Protein of unknown function (DUF3293)
MVLAPEDPWSGYARLVVEIERAGEVSEVDEVDDAVDGAIVVRAAPLGQIGPWPWSSPEPVHIVTAWNPGTSRPGVEANRTEQARLEDEVRALAATMWSARGRDPLTGERDEGVAVRGLAEADVRALGARYGQDAIFAWSPLEWAIVSCRGARREVAGWSLG